MLRAVVRCARDVARLPLFPPEQSRDDAELIDDEDDEDDDEFPELGTVLSTFWIGLLHALYADAARDMTQELQRNLIALSMRRPPRFLLSVTSDVAKTDVPAMLDQFLTGSKDETHSVLDAFDFPEHLMDSIDPRDCVVELGLSFTKGKISVVLLSALLDVVHRRRERDGGTQFRVTALRFRRECTFQPKALELLGEWRRDAHRSPIRSLRLGNLSDLRSGPIQCLTGLFTSLNRLQRLSTSNYDSFSAVASAVRSGSSCGLAEVDVRYAPSVENAARLAFAFFHVDSKSTVSSVCLRAPRSKEDKLEVYLSTEWMAAFKRVLCSARAERDLANMEGAASAVRDATRTLVTITPDTTVKIGPYAGARTMCRLTSSGGVNEFEKLAENRHSIAVVIPGVGVGWVLASAVLSERAVTSLVYCKDATMLTNSRVTSFTWDGASPPCTSYHPDRDLHASLLLQLLSAIGRPLTRLHIPNTRLTPEILHEILCLCPNLTDLNATGHTMSTVRPLADAYARGDCKIETLSIARTARSLLERDSILSKTRGSNRLRRIMVRAPRTTVSNATGDLFAAAASASPQLEYVHMVGIDAYDLLVEAEVTFDLSARPLSFSPMTLASKLALLSVVSFESGRGSALGRLDASVLSEILRFSHDAIARHVLKNAPLAVERCECAECEHREHVRASWGDDD